jgi:peroxiredoxin
MRRCWIIFFRSFVLGSRKVTSLAIAMKIKERIIESSKGGLYEPVYIGGHIQSNQSTMKLLFLLISLIIANEILAQTPEEQRYLDTLRMGGAHVVGRPFPQFELRTSKGEVFNNASLKDRVTVINFGFQACAPCIAEKDALNNLFEDFKIYKRFLLLSITYDDSTIIQKSLQVHKIKYPVLKTTIDGCSLLNFKQGYPTSMIIDSTGTVIYCVVGGPVDPQKATKTILETIYPILIRELK